MAPAPAALVLVLPLVAVAFPVFARKRPLSFALSSLSEQVRGVGFSVNKTLLSSSDVYCPSSPAFALVLLAEAS